MERIVVAIKIDGDLWKEVRHRCIDEGTKYSTYTENALKEALKKKAK